MRKLTAVLLTLVMIFSCAFACAEEGTEASESMIGIISAMQNEVDLLLSKAEIIGYINEGLLPVPYNKSYNLADYESLKTQAEENRRNRDAAPEEMSDDPSDEIAITVGDEKISAARSGWN